MDGSGKPEVVPGSVVPNSFPSGGMGISSDGKVLGYILEIVDAATQRGQEKLALLDLGSSAPRLLNADSRVAQAAWHLLLMVKESLIRSTKTASIIFGSNRLTARPAIRSLILLPRRSIHFIGRRTEKHWESCAAIRSRMWCCCRKRSNRRSSSCNGRKSFLNYL